MSKNCFSEIGKLEIEGRFKKSSVELADHGGWLIYDGRELDREEYAELFAIIGTSFGAGDRKTTFNLPNFEELCNRKNAEKQKDGYIVEGAPQIAGCVKGDDFVPACYPACHDFTAEQPHPVFGSVKPLTLEEWAKRKKQHIFIFAKKL